MAKARAESTYHHGDLRSTLLRAAVELIAERGAAGLSLRECARRAGVSHAAPYRHFADKDALLLAIAREGFAWLAEAGVAAMKAVKTPRERLDEYGVAYVRFALEHPVHVRIMFTMQYDQTPEAEGVGRVAFQLLEEAAVAVAGPDVDPREVAVAAWTLPHGLSMLILDKRIPVEFVETTDDAERLARQVYALWRGPLGHPR